MGFTYKPMVQLCIHFVASIYILIAAVVVVVVEVMGGGSSIRITCNRRGVVVVVVVAVLVFIIILLLLLLLIQFLPGRLAASCSYCDWRSCVVMLHRTNTQATAKSKGKKGIRTT